MIIAKTPLRISFLGGGSDFRAHYRAHGGAVLSAAIDKYVHVTVSPSFDGRVHLHYSRIEVVDCACELQHDIVRAALAQAGIESGIEIHLIADVTGEGTGLGSSSALAVGLVNALWYRNLGEHLPSKQIAEMACALEIDILKKPIGEQDQRIAVAGGMRLFKFFSDTEPPWLETVPQDTVYELKRHVLLFDTQLKRNAYEILSEQNARIASNTLRLNALATFARRGYEDLCAGDYRVFGTRMDDAWRNKQALANGITNPQIDSLYHAALHAGAFGGKICGAGGGGYLLLIAPPEKHEAIRGALGLREMRVRLGVEGSVVREL